MPVVDPDSRREATVIFKLAVKASSAAVHRTLNRAPKGKGWVQCFNSPAGIMCRPEKVRESIALFTKAYETYHHGLYHGGELIIGVNTDLAYPHRAQLPESYAGFRVLQYCAA